MVSNITDSHCHLDYLKEKGFAIEVILEEAFTVGVKYFLTISVNWQSRQKILNIAEQYENVFCSVGIHPLFHSLDEEIHVKDFCRFLKKSKKIIGIGECGLDYLKGSSRGQYEIFIKQIYAAQETGFPLIIHMRESEEDMLKILKREHSTRKIKGVIHSFSGSRDFMEEVLALGFYISISGIVSFKKATLVRDNVKNIPLTKLIIETDSPYLTPVPFRGKINHPKYVYYVLREVSRIINMDNQDLADVTTNNFFDLFNCKCPRISD